MVYFIFDFKRLSDSFVVVFSPLIHKVQCMNDEGASLSFSFLDLFREACNARILERKQPEKKGFFVSTPTSLSQARLKVSTMTTEG